MGKIEKNELVCVDQTRCSLGPFRLKGEYQSAVSSLLVVGLVLAVLVVVVLAAVVEAAGLTVVVLIALVVALVVLLLAFVAVALVAIVVVVLVVAAVLSSWDGEIATENVEETNDEGRQSVDKAVESFSDLLQSVDLVQ